VTDHTSIGRPTRLAILKGGLMTFGVEVLVVAGFALVATVIAVIALALD
jgi:hypothetical protein